MFFERVAAPLWKYHRETEIWVNKNIQYWAATELWGALYGFDTTERERASALRWLHAEYLYLSAALNNRTEHEKSVAF